MAAKADGSVTARAAAKTPSTKTINKRLNSARKQLASTRKQVRSTGRQVASARRSIRKVSTDMGALAARLKNAEGGVGTILAAAPQLVTGLQTLANAVQTQIAPGLQKLAAAVETQIAPGLQKLATAVETQIAPGLKKLSDAVQNEIAPALQDVGTYATAQEYGVTRVFTGPGAAGPAIPITVPSADIPDDGNGVSASGEIPVQVGSPAAGGIPEGTLLTARSVIRSGEADGGADGDPAGQVGGLLTMTCGFAADGTCDVDPGDGNVPVPVGAVVCLQGPPPAQDIELPDGSTGSFPIVTIQEKAERTGVARPTADDPNPVEGSPDRPLPLNNNAEDGCNLGENGDLYLLNVQTQFFDIPTSTDPGPAD